MRPNPQFKDAPEWEARFYRVAREVASWGHDRDGCVGCVLVSPDGLDVSWGYSGLPRDLRGEDELDPETRRELTAHAEVNAVVNAGCPVRQWTAYVTKHPCKDCALLLAQAGVATVVCPPKSADGRWIESQRAAEEVFHRCGITVREMAGEDRT